MNDEARLGVVVSGSLSEGLAVKLDAGSSIAPSSAEVTLPERATWARRLVRAFSIGPREDLI